MHDGGFWKRTISLASLSEISRSGFQIPLKCQPLFLTGERIPNSLKNAQTVVSFHLLTKAGI